MVNVDVYSAASIIDFDKLSDGSVWSWGKSEKGRLGRLEGENYIPDPVQLGDTGPYTIESLSSSHATTLLAIRRKAMLFLSATNKHERKMAFLPTKTVQI